MNVLIVEDEYSAATALQKMLCDIDRTAHVVGMTDSIEETVEWLAANPSPDLVFMDIHLADGSAFTIFEHTAVTSPVIFTTAYEEYALKAFEVNSVDYLLKPIQEAHLCRALKKYHDRDSAALDPKTLQTLLSAISVGGSRLRNLLVPAGDRMIPVSVKEIAFLHSEEHQCVLYLKRGKTHCIDMSLDAIQKRLPSEHFFRVNRQYIVALDAVVDLTFWFTGKMVVNLNMPVPERVVLPRARISSFKQWLQQGK